MTYKTGMVPAPGNHVDAIVPTFPKKVIVGCIICSAGPFNSLEARQAHVNEIHLSCKACHFLASNEHEYNSHRTSRRHEETIAYGAPREPLPVFAPVTLAAPPALPDHEPSVSFRCGESGCEREFETERGMKHHVATMHKGEFREPMRGPDDGPLPNVRPASPLECPHRCGHALFKNEAGLTMHLTRIHKSTIPPRFSIVDELLKDEPEEADDESPAIPAPEEVRPESVVVAATPAPSPSPAENVVTEPPVDWLPMIGELNERIVQLTERLDIWEGEMTGETPSPETRLSLLELHLEEQINHGWFNDFQSRYIGIVLDRLAAKSISLDCGGLMNRIEHLLWGKPS